MAIRYIHEFSSLAEFNQASRDLPNALAFGAFSNAFYPGQDSASANTHFRFNTQADNRNIRLNSRNYTDTSGGNSAVQIKPNQNVTTTGDLAGLEVSPRFNDCDGGSLVCIKADPVIKDATAARTVAAIRGLEINIDLPNAGSAVTFTNDVTAIRIFPDFGSGHTFSGVRCIMEIANPNTSQFQYFLEIESSNSSWVETTETVATQNGWIKVRVGGTDHFIPLYDSAS